jgi:hypothetical protein
MFLEKLLMRAIFSNWTWLKFGHQWYNILIAIQERFIVAWQLNYFMSSAT